MRRIYMSSLIAIMLLLIASGCSFTQSLTAGVSKAPDKDLYNQVPTSMRADVTEAQFDLKEAKASLGNLREKLQLSKLVEERSKAFTKMRQLEFTEAEYLQKEAEIALDISKWDAVDNSELGDKELIVKTIGNLKSDKLSQEAARAKVQAAITNSKFKIQEIDKQIAEQKMKIK